MIFVVKIQLKKLSIGILNRFLITKTPFLLTYAFSRLIIIQIKETVFHHEQKKFFSLCKRNYYYFYSAKTKHSKFTIACWSSFSFCIRFSYTDYSS